MSGRGGGGGEGPGEAVAMRAPLAEPGTRRFNFLLWVVFLGPAVVWAVRFGLVYALVPFVCVTGTVGLLHATTLLALGVIAAMGGYGWRAWRSAREVVEGPARGDDVERDFARRVRFMALFGLMGAALFAVVVIAEGLANVMIDPCQIAGPLMPH